MLLTIYAKKRTGKEGKPFYTYLTTLNKKNGVPHTVQAKFTYDAGAPKADACPVNIEVSKDDINLVSKPFTRKDGTPDISWILWIHKWQYGPAYEDHSLDDYDLD